jgi:hypothetical protein
LIRAEGKAEKGWEDGEQNDPPSRRTDSLEDALKGNGQKVGGKRKEYGKKVHSYGVIALFQKIRVSARKKIGAKGCGVGAVKNNIDQKKNQPHTARDKETLFPLPKGKKEPSES